MNISGFTGRVSRFGRSESYLEDNKGSHTRFVNSVRTPPANLELFVHHVLPLAGTSPRPYRHPSARSWLEESTFRSIRVYQGW